MLKCQTIQKNMKSFVSILVLIGLAAPILGATRNICYQQEAVDYVVAQCKAVVKISDNDYTKFRNGDDLTSKNGREFFYCYFDRAGAFELDGNLNYELLWIRLYYITLQVDYTTQVIEECRLEAIQVYGNGSSKKGKKHHSGSDSDSDSSDSDSSDSDSSDSDSSDSDSSDSDSDSHDSGEHKRPSKQYLDISVYYGQCIKKTVPQFEIIG